MTTSWDPRQSSSYRAALADGLVEPAFVRFPQWSRTLGPEVGQVAALADYPADPEQQIALDATFALTAAGRSAASTVVAIACRQNLKTGLIKQIELGWLFVTGERLVVHSAHEFDTSREAFRDMRNLIEGCAVLRKRIKPGGIKGTPADMSIETLAGARLVYKTRTKGAGVGKSPRKVVLDEAYALVPEHMSALRFSISAQLDPQIIVASSAAHPESDVLRAFVKRGREGNEERLAYFEWCIKNGVSACRDGENCTHVVGEAAGCILDDLDALRLANPQLGKRLQVQTILDERAECVTIELAAVFFRERGGLHDDPVQGKTRIDLVKWHKQADTSSALVGPVAIAFDVTPKATAAAIAAVGRIEGDVWRGEITGHDDGNGVIVPDSRPGTGWLVGRLVEIVLNPDNDVCCVVMDSASEAGAFEKELLAYRRDENDPDSTVFVKVAKPADRVPPGKTRLVVISGREYTQACAALDNEISNERWRHFGQKPLNDAVEGARETPSGDAWKWSRKDSTVNIAPLVATTLARHGFAAFGEARRLEPYIGFGRR